MLNDPLAAALSKILNSEKRSKKEVLIKPTSNTIKTILTTMNENNYLGTFEEIKDGTLVLSPASVKSIYLSQIEINIDDYPIQEDLQTYIIGCYVSGVDQLVLRSEKEISTMQRELVSNLLKNLFGFEIIKEEEQKIIIASIGESYAMITLIERVLSTVNLMFSSILKLAIEKPSSGKKEDEEEKPNITDGQMNIIRAANENNAKILTILLNFCLLQKLHQ